MHTRQAAVGRGPAIMAALVLPSLAGAVTDRLLDSPGPGWYLIAGSIAGALLAGLLAARRTAVWSVVPLPPLSAAACAAVAGLLGNPGAGTGPLTGVMRWAAASFPASVAGEATVLAVAVCATLRRAQRRSTVRESHHA
ncbi:hypothetical protein ACFCXT_23325 [Streptomyces vinaceus]|uniref:hypothetical protein n=1 Tax=Streptomyces vinaceus TaxID=1960 RepID=UPI0035D7694F